ncbi:MAG: transcriptional regulator [Calditrichaceae bacterium]|nr:transcriptional regulator [Calditrichaceae bacterium]
MIFIETTIFTKLIENYLDDDEYLGLQKYLLKYPDKGDIIPGTGGVRKLRWLVSGKGKRGGIRVIYYWKKQDEEIWMLTVYEKSEKSTIPNHIIKKIAEEIKNA